MAVERKEDLKALHEYHVRIPVAWSGKELTTTPYKLQPDEITTIRILAEQRGHTIGQFVAEAIHDKLQRQQKHQPTKKFKGRCSTNETHQNPSGRQK